MPLLPAPIYTAENCQFSCPLQWGLTVFWRSPPSDDDWFVSLATSLEVDGIRALGHRFDSPCTSQFVISTQPQVSPQHVVQRVKGRLQHLVRDRLPKAFRGNFAIRSFGNVSRTTVEEYVSKQVEHHPMADPRVVERLQHLQITNADINLADPQRTSQGLFWNNLHIVLVHRDRWIDVQEESLRSVQQMIVRSCAAKGYRLSRAGILPDHVHLAVGCGFDVSPGEVTLGFLNNLAYVRGMEPVYQFGAFMGTFGEYDRRAVESDTTL